MQNILSKISQPILSEKRCWEDNSGTESLVLLKLCSHWMVALAPALLNGGSKGEPLS